MIVNRQMDSIKVDSSITRSALLRMLRDRQSNIRNAALRLQLQPNVRRAPTFTRLPGSIQRVRSSPVCRPKTAGVALELRPDVRPAISRPSTAGVNVPNRVDNRMVNSAFSRPSTTGSRTKSARSIVSEPLFINQLASDDLLAGGFHSEDCDTPAISILKRTVAHGSTFCDVIGPQTCHQCVKNTRRDNDDRARSNVQHEHVAVLEAACNALPELSVSEVKEQLSNGSILQPYFRTWLEARKGRCVKPCEENLRVHQNTTQPVPQPVVGHLCNSKSIINEKRPLLTKLDQDKQRQPVVGRLCNHKSGKAERRPLLLKFDQLDLLNTFQFVNIHPTFVSTRKTQVRVDSPQVDCKYTGPPLIAKECQNVDKKKFDLCDARYSLPDRLPDELFADDGGQ